MIKHLLFLWESKEIRQQIFLFFLIKILRCIFQMFHVLVVQLKLCSPSQHPSLLFSPSDNYSYVFLKLNWALNYFLLSKRLLFLKSKHILYCKLSIWLRHPSCFTVLALDHLWKVRGNHDYGNFIFKKYFAVIVHVFIVEKAQFWQQLKLTAYWNTPMNSEVCLV